MLARAPLFLLSLLLLSSTLLAGCPGGAASIAVTPQRLDFGEVPVGSASSLTVLITNEGDAATVLSFAIAGDGPFEVVLTGSISVEPGDSRVVFVEASPVAEGVATGTLTLAWSEAVAEVDLQVLGVGAAADEDGDGYSVEVDCDDTNPAVNPGATEVCNGLDDDCQGGVDEDFDADDDGTTTCGPDGLAGTSDDDCDDTDDTVAPDATEVCDGIDNDCDESADEGFDADGDGFTSCGGDCDDTDDAVNEGATESCNGLDDDCDSVIDNGYADVDGDGETLCTDCDDTDPTAAHGLPELCDGADNDCNGSVDDGFPDADSDGYDSCADCDDGEAAANPGASEVCDGVLDNDCDGNDDPQELDDDSDGASECGGDCDDGDPALNLSDADGDGVDTCGLDCDDNDANNYPGNTELCDGVDNDCDGVPESSADGDGDGVTVCAGDCDDGDPAINPSAVEACDGVDNDCDASIDEGFTDADTDGAASCVDCDDTNPNVFPGNVEACDSLDNDCDTTIDEGFDADGDGAFDGSDPGCVLAYGAAVDCDDGAAAAYPGAPDVCDAILDNDCDTVTDPQEDDSDSDGASECGGDCDDADPALSVADVDGDGVSTCDGTPDCDDAVPSVFPGATEVCDGVDQDCDTVADNGFDGDGDGAFAGSDAGCVATYGAGNVDCDDGEAAVYPGAPDVCDGILDNNCDTVTDPQEDDGDGDGGGFCDGDCDDGDPNANLNDVDGDGATTCDPTPDCDDNDPAYVPGATEYCSGEDLNCDTVFPAACLTCADALDADPTRFGADGVYEIDPDGVGVGDPAFDAFCDMTTDGGGWTLAMRSTDDGVANGALITNYASFYGSNVGAASSGVHRVAGKHWETLATNGDAADEIMVTHVLKKAGGGNCDPLSYATTGATNTLSMTGAGAATYAYTGGDPYAIVNGPAADGGIAIAFFSASDNGPSAASCVVTYNTAPWFYSGAACGQSFATVDSIFATPRPTVRSNRVEAADVTAACGGAAVLTTSGVWYNEATYSLFLR